MPCFKITFSNGAIRWVFCNSRKPDGDAAAILDTGVPRANMELELRERPETNYGTSKKSAPRRKIFVPVFVPKKSKRAIATLARTGRKKK